jgi:hypothetical protein
MLSAMKHPRSLAWFAACLALASCSDFNGPISGGSFNPLLSPGAQLVQPEDAGANYTFKAGQYVTAASNATAFFSKKPQGNAEADELLSAGTSMRVIKSDGSFVKVELDSGKVGFVAAALLLESGVASGDTMTAPDANTTSPLVPEGQSSIPPIVPPSADLPESAPEAVPPLEVPLPEPADSRQKANP